MLGPLSSLGVGAEFRVYGLWFMVEGFEFPVCGGLGFASVMVQGLWSRVLGFLFPVWNLPVSGFRVSGFGLTVWGWFGGGSRS